MLPQPLLGNLHHYYQPLFIILEHLAASLTIEVIGFILVFWDCSGYQCMFKMRSTYDCDICGKTYASANSLKTHKNRHDQVAVRKCS